mmetsp:Transcript_19738/g.47941  ORF Transcript_19738/g.47941 Transcript_19738/m.47941 type:complete len:301 (-) Transcript_19738:85-987(-)
MRLFLALLLQTAARLRGEPLQEEVEEIAAESRSEESVVDKQVQALLDSSRSQPLQVGQQESEIPAEAPPTALAKRLLSEADAAKKAESAADAAVVASVKQAEADEEESEKSFAASESDEEPTQADRQRFDGATAKVRKALEQTPSNSVDVKLRTNATKQTAPAELQPSSTTAEKSESAKTAVVEPSTSSAEKSESAPEGEATPATSFVASDFEPIFQYILMTEEKDCPAFAKAVGLVQLAVRKRNKMATEEAVSKCLSTCGFQGDAASVQQQYPLSCCPNDCYAEEEAAFMACALKCPPV